MQWARTGEISTVIRLCMTEIAHRKWSMVQCIIKIIKENKNRDFIREF